MSEIPIPPDPEGKVIILIEAFLASEGDLTDSGSLDFTDVKVRGEEKVQGDEPPFIIITRSAISDFPFGAGTGRLGVADHTFTVRCYGRKKVSGEREAARLAGLVRAALHNHPPVVMGNIGIHRIRVLSTGAPLTDPVEQIPYVPVSVGLYASALAVAS